MKLNEVKINEKVKILNFENDKRVVTRLNNVGIKVGDNVTVCAIAPFKTPIEIKSGNIRLAIDGKEAAKIAVKYV